MDVLITPKFLSGRVTPPSSKSMAHRAILAAALAEGESRVENLSFSQDIQATLDCVGLLGCEWSQPSSDTVVLQGSGKRGVSSEELPLFDCGESGSTLRFLIPIALAVRGGGRFTGRGRLMERPQKPYFDIFEEKGISYSREGGVLTVQGKLPPGEYRLPGNVSSQFVTGLLYALPLLDGDSEIVLTSALESSGYVDMTLQMLDTFGIKVEKDGGQYRVPGGQAYASRTVTVEGDWSQAGFWYAAKALGNPVEIVGLKGDSAQGDRVVKEHFFRLSQDGEVEIDLSGCPDLLPPLAVMAAARRDITRFTGAARLRLKESDRLATVHALLTALGCPAQEGPDSLTVHGQGPGLTGGTADGANDHRIVMAAAIAATACQRPVKILGAQAVDKSYPAFWQHYQQLGGEISVL